jgi:hypothetical protein
MKKVGLYYYPKTTLLFNRLMGHTPDFIPYKGRHRFVRAKRIYHPNGRISPSTIRIRKVTYSGGGHKRIIW